MGAIKPQSRAPRKSSSGAARGEAGSAGRETVLPGNAAAAGSWRPWLRRPRAAALGNAGGSVPPGPAALAAAAPAPSLGRCVTWPGWRASLQGPRNPLPAPPAPLQRAPRHPIRPPRNPGWPAGRTQAENLGARLLIVDTQAACQPPARSGKLFGAYFTVMLRGRGELPKMRDVRGEIHKCTPWQTDVSPLLPVNLWFCFLPRSGKCVPGVCTVACL